MVQQGTVRRQESDRDLKRLTVPKFRLFLFLLNIEFFELTQFFPQLDQKSNFSGQTEVTDDQVRNGLQKTDSIDFLLVSVPS